MAVDTRLIIGGEDRTKAAIGSARRNIDTLGSAVRKAAGAFAVLAGAGGVASAVNSVTELGSDLVDLRRRLGTNVEAMSELRIVASRTGVSFGTLTTALQRQSRRVAEAAKGAGAAKDALRDLGLETSALLALSPDQQFERIAEAIARVQNPSEQAAIAMKIWDTEGVKLLQTINEFGGDIGRAREDARAFGGTLSEVEATQLKAAREGFNDFKLRIQGVVTELVVRAAPGLELVASLLQGLVSTVLGTAKAFAGLGAAVASSLTGLILRPIEGVIKSVGFLGRTLLQVFRGQFSAAVDSAKSAGSAIGQSILDAAEDIRLGGTITGLAFDDIRETASEAAGTISTAWQRMGERTDRAAVQIQRDTQSSADSIESFSSAMNLTAQAAARAADQTARATSQQASGVQESSARQRSSIGNLRQSLSSLDQTYRDLGANVAGQVRPQIDGLTSSFERNQEASRSAREERERDNRTSLSVRAGSPFVFGIGDSRVLFGADGRAIRRLRRGELTADAIASIGRAAGATFATGTSAAPRNMLARLEQGERVVSNNTNVTLNFSTVPTNPSQFRDWVRSILVPEIRVATARG